MSFAHLYSAIRLRIFDDWPPVFHITQWKAGSQWIREVLTRCIPNKTVMPSFNGDEVIRRNTVYTAAYLSKQEYEGLNAPGDSKYFIILRDPRDILVSGYYSLRFSHVSIPGIAEQRQELQTVTQDDGMLRTMDSLVRPCVEIALSWVKTGAKWIRYEELLTNDVGLLSQALLVDCGLPINMKALEDAVLACRFEKFSGGRKPGQEDINSHFRKGVAGDWKNQFSPHIKDVFKERFGEALKICGYEKGNDW
jgi:lipopolysaccharide transport system ATP-binding protein